MGLTELLALVLPISHFVCTWVYVGAAVFSNAIQPVGFGLFTIVALQFSGLIFFLRNGSAKETFPTFLNIFWFIFVGANLIFLIIVGVWAGFGGLHTIPRYAASIAFATLDFLINAAMVVLTVLNRGHTGGGFQPPPVTTP